MTIGNNAFHGALFDYQVVGVKAGLSLPNTHHHHFAALVSAVQRLVEHGGNAGHFEGHVHPAAAQGVQFLHRVLLLWVDDHGSQRFGFGLTRWRNFHRINLCSPCGFKRFDGH